MTILELLAILAAGAVASTIAWIESSRDPAIASAAVLLLGAFAFGGALATIVS
jgi:uncharacterized membrane protein